MTMTLTEVVSHLTNGNALTWQGSGPFKAGTIHLDQAGPRRLFKFLVEANDDDVANAADNLFEGLTSAWEDEGNDPANDQAPPLVLASTGPWRLMNIEATGFGGLNTPDGPPFQLNVGGENWCLEGYNGSGKTSLASAILWTLTGYRNREQDGPHKDNGKREDVTDGTKKIGTWPPLVTYPSKPEDLENTARVSAVLTFADPSGKSASITRTVESPVQGEPIVTTTINGDLVLPPELIETGLLMPARIGHVGFGAKSQTLYDALKMLTGLDQLAAIGLGATGFCHGAKRFLKYAKNNGIEGFERAFSTCLERAVELSIDTSVKIPGTLKLGQATLAAELTAIETDASIKAGTALAVLKAEIAPDVDLKSATERDRLTSAVNQARVYLREGTGGVSLFKAWAALKQAHDAGFSDTKNALLAANAAVATALNWHHKQQIDKKLRLKALASKFYVSEDLLGEKASCPLCETLFTSEEQLVLSAELASLKQDTLYAERAIADACSDIIKTLNALVPDTLVQHDKELAAMDPAAAFAAAIKARFSDNPPFSDLLTGISSFTSTTADKCAQDLPSFVHTSSSSTASDVPEVEEVQAVIAKIARLSALTAWWAENRLSFVAAWDGFIGKKNADGGWPPESLEGKLHNLEDAISGSGPLDKIAKQMTAAKEALQSWTKIQTVQNIREDIAAALEPLKLLQHLVDCETHRTVVTLKDRVTSILDDIRLKDRLSFVDTAMAKKAVNVEGRFAEGMQIDAALVANSSWLRALLWAFMFALREQAIADSGTNLFPLMVLDDPQTTFDPKNKRKWASKITEMANHDVTNPQGMQLFLTTHERQFADIICVTCELSGQVGKMAGPTASSKVANIVNGTFLDRQFAVASSDEDDEEGFKYIQQVRVYCEDLLKIMLRPESYEISGDTFGKLCELLAKLNKDGVAPFDRSTFVNLLKFLNEKTVPIMKVINAPHHTFDGTIGYAQAQDVHKYWKDKLQNAFVSAFRRAADFDAFGGVSHLFLVEKNVVEFPVGHTENIKALTFTSTGMAAAAESDGLVGSGLIEIEEWETPESITLFNHTAYRLNAGTLDPVAGIGDVIFVQDFGEPRSLNLTVTALGNKLYARRLIETQDVADVVVLTAQSTDPYALHVPVIAPRDKIKPRKVVGTLFMSKTVSLPVNDGNEVCMIEDFSVIAARLKNVKLFKVKGRSMEPIALDGQFVMTVEETLNHSTLTNLNGGLVIAVDDDAGVYFKRLRIHGDLVVLESANSSLSTSSEILALHDGSKFKKLTSVRAVVGVLFDLPLQE